VGDALIVFVARNVKTGKAYQVPEMKVSRYDDVLTTRKCFELGLTIKDWSKDKSMRDMQEKIPDYLESRNYEETRRKLRQQMLIDPLSVVKMASTLKQTKILMHS